MTKLPGELKLVTCVGCGVDAVGRSTPLKVAKHALAVNPELRMCGGRIKGRPYCSACLAENPARISGIAGGLPSSGENPSPWGENAVRALENR